MHKLTIENVKASGMLIFEAVSGSKAYGLATATSDTDIRGVFIMPEDDFYGLEYTPQVNNESNDIVYYELRRFIELLSKNNPTMMELLNTPSDCVITRDPLMDMLKPGMFLSRLCEESFANYAYSQIKKAYGLEKKILNPVEQHRKSVTDFCFVFADGKTSSLEDFLAQRKWIQQSIGLANISHMRDCYQVFHSTNLKYAGVIKKEESNEVALSSIPIGEKLVGVLYFNRDMYSIYCKKYKEYWDWVEKRNDVRYNTTITHGKKYDSKNMMHVFRLLSMAREIALEGRLNVRRNDREYLLSIKNGEQEYDDLLAKAEQMKADLPSLYQRSNLPDKPDQAAINKVLISIRKQFYHKKELKK